jgi:hypothetical protein
LMPRRTEVTAGLGSDAVSELSRSNSANSSLWSLRTMSLRVDRARTAHHQPRCREATAHVTTPPRSAIPTQPPTHHTAPRHVAVIATQGVHDGSTARSIGMDL